MILSKCWMCDSKKSKFVKDQEASGLLISLGIKTALSKLPLVGLIFCFNSIKQVKYKV